MRSRIAGLAGYLGQARARLLLVGCAILFGLAIAAATGVVGYRLWRADVADNERELRNVSMVLSEEIDGSLTAIDRVETGVVERLQPSGLATEYGFEQGALAEESYTDLKSRISGLTQIALLAVVNQSGQLLSSSRFWPAPPMAIAQPAYADAVHSDTAEAFISAPVRDPDTGTWVMYFTRRIDGAAGQVRGFVIAAIDLGYFERSFARFALAGNASFSLFRDDGTVIARRPHVDPAAQPSYRQDEGFQQRLAARDGEVIHQRSLFDGKIRLVVPYRIAHYPLLINATLAFDDILSQWHAEVLPLITVSLLAELGIAGMVVLGVRDLRSFEKARSADAARMMAEAQLALAGQREQAAHDLNAQLVRFDTAVSNMVQGLLMCDHASRVLVANHRFAELLGLSADDIVPGMTCAELAERAVKAGNVGRRDVEGLQQRRVETLGGRARQHFAFELEDGRVFMITNQPTGEGWLATYEDVTEHREAEARISHLAHHDALTDLPNRVLFQENLEAALSHARRGHGLALLFLDLDQFKMVNDTLGHSVGDVLLQSVAERLSQQTRETDTIARLGGDEFAIIQTPIDEPTEAAALAERLIEMLETPFDVAGHQIVIGTSVGIAFAPQDGLDADQLSKCADLALYRAKVDGRGMYRLFQAEMDAAMQARRILELDLRNALPAGQLEVFFQPLIDVRARAIAGCEALLRWRHPTKGLVRPDRFIALAEETGMIVPMGEWVLRQACAVASTWPEPMKVAVNLSPVQFRSHHLVQTVAAALSELGLRPSRLELEITETVLLHDTDLTLETLHKLRDLGIQIAMDDFGTGYSSLSYLRKFPFDRIKIDQSFVRELGTQADCIAIVRAVATLGADLGMAITAEGVETRQQLNTLERAGCTEVQGYLFSRAVSAAALNTLLRTQPFSADGWPSSAECAMTEPAVEREPLPAL